MSLTIDDIQRTAQLARIQITPEEQPAYLNDLNNILNLVAQMSSVNTDGISPFAHLEGTKQRLRPDYIKEINQRDLFQQIAPHTQDGYYLVPTVIED